LTSSFTGLLAASAMTSPGHPHDGQKTARLETGLEQSGQLTSEADNADTARMAVMQKLMIFRNMNNVPMMNESAFEIYGYGKI
jgi:hypothetical protein